MQPQVIGTGPSRPDVFGPIRTTRHARRPSGTAAWLLLAIAAWAADAPWATAQSVGDPAANAPVQRPNVVLILGDDQGWADYGFMGHPHIETPRLDRLAAEGLTFTRGYVPASLCRPSLASIVTGLFPHQHRLVGNNPPMPPELRGRPTIQLRDEPAYRASWDGMIAHIERVPTLPRLLGEVGYASHQSGKWWEGNYRRGGFTAGMTHGDPARGGRHGDEGLKIGRQGMQPVFEFIDAAVAEGKPFFVWYAPFLPHMPHNPPERLLEKYLPKAPAENVARYWAMCEWFDETCGELLDHLDRKGLAADTLVVLVCDNGWNEPVDRGEYLGGGVGGPRAKRSPYDGGIRTPIILRRTGRIAARRDVTTLASSIDLAPTILRACGLEPPETMPGINLLDAAALERREAVFGDIYEHDVRDLDDPAASLRYRWIIEGWWKLIVPHEPNVPDGRVELFDLKADPAEARNLAGDEPQRVARLRAALDAWWPASPRPRDEAPGP